MIHIVKGNLLESDCNVIAHQVNCMGVMGAGVALQIKEKYPWAWHAYKYICHANMGEPYELLGQAQVVPEHCEPDKYGYVRSDRLHVVHLYAQYKYGKGKHTVYKALEDALHEMLRGLASHHRKFGLPFGLGCGLAGGDWNVVLDIIERVFCLNKQDAYLYKL